MKKNKNKKKAFWPWLRNVSVYGLMFPVSAWSATQQAVVSAEQWELSRNGERMVQLQALQKTVGAWDNVDRHVIELQYPGGEEGELWVNELKDWLISLGVPSKYLVIVPGSGQDDIIRLRLTYGGEQFQ